MSDLKNELKSIFLANELKNQEGESFAHYGVKGMRWGYRKDSSGRHRPTKQVEKENKRKSKKAEKAAPKSRSNNKLASNPQNKGMTDRQMKQAIDRIKLQQEFNRLTATPPDPPNKVAKFMGEVGRDVARGAMTEVGKLVLSQALKVEYNKRAGTDYKIPMKQLTEAYDKAKNS